MKKILILCLVLLSIQVKSQTFDGVFIGGSATKCIENLKLKNYRVVVYNPQGHSYKIVGKKDGVTLECYLFKNKSGRVRSFDCYLPTQTNYTLLYNQFYEYRESLKEKYGEPLQEKFEFVSPYSDNDGYEMQAIRYEKLKAFCVFNGGENTTIYLTIYRTGQVLVGVSNDAMQREHDAETSQTIQKTF